jgi:hypothetical protein
MVFLAWRRSQLVYLVVILLAGLVLSRAGSNAKLVIGAAVLTVVGLLLMGNVLFLDSAPALAERISSLWHLLSGNWDDDSLANWRGRVEGTWRDYLHLFAEFPWGLGLYPPTILETGSDNAYLTYLAWGGIPLLGLYVALMVSSLALGVRVASYTGAPRAYASIGVTLPLLALTHMLTGVTGGGVMALPHYAVFWVVLAQAALTYRRIQVDQCGTGGAWRVGGSRLQSAGPNKHEWGVQ